MSVRQFFEDIVFEGEVRFNRDAVRFIDVLVGTTPTIKYTVYYKSHASAVTVTNFLGGSEGKEVVILGNGNTTITHGTNIFTSTGANKVLLANKIYRFTYIEGKWYEDG